MATGGTLLNLLPSKEGKAGEKYQSTAAGARTIIDGVENRRSNTGAFTIADGVKNILHSENCRKTPIHNLSNSEGSKSSHPCRAQLPNSDLIEIEHSEAKPREKTEIPTPWSRLPEPEPPLTAWKKVDPKPNLAPPPTA